MPNAVPASAGSRPQGTAVRRIQRKRLQSPGLPVIAILRAAIVCEVWPARCGGDPLIKRRLAA